MSRIGIGVWLCLGVAAMAYAEVVPSQTGDLHHEVQRLTAMVEQLQQTVEQQQGRIAVLERDATVPVRIALAPSGGLQAFNPEIGIIGDVVAQLSQSREDAEGNDKISLRELELIFGQDVDPYSRFDATVTFSDFEDPSVEEAYITRWGLPGEVKARLGRMRPKIGKATAVHRDQLDTVDEPLVVQRYLGVEGLFRSGVELSSFVPTPWDQVTHEVIGGVMEGGIGEEGTLFGENRRRPSFYTRLRNSWDVSDETWVELGSTYLTGSADADERFEVNALGLDATLTHFVTPVNKLKWQNEVYLQDRDETEEGVQDNPWGLYSLLDYRFAPRWGAGGRFDYVQPVDNATTNPRDADTAWNAYLTFYQSEFARWRLQYQHLEQAGGGNNDTVFLQGTVAIGVHKHQLQ